MEELEGTGWPMQQLDQKTFLLAFSSQGFCRRMKEIFLRKDIQQTKKKKENEKKDMSMTKEVRVLLENRLRTGQST